LYAHRVEAGQEIGTRMVNDAQTEIAAFVSQNSGGPLNVTKMLAAIDTNISDIKKKRGRVDSAIPICSVMNTLVHMHSNPIIDVEINENFMSIKAL
jgi:hypothetical protein